VTGLNHIDLHLGKFKYIISMKNRGSTKLSH